MVKTTTTKKTIKTAPPKKKAKEVKEPKEAKKPAKVKKEALPTEGGYSLVIVESPSKAKTIKKYLGKGFQVVACNGHIKDLPKSKLGVDIKNFELELVPITGKKDKIERIQELALKASRIYLAPDPDREGEAIAFHLAEEIGNSKPIQRVLFNAITKTAVQAAINSPSELDARKYESQKTRRVLDRLVGYKISPILWDKVQRGLSAGRVQSVALRVIVDKEDLIRAFKSEQWFSIHAPFKKDNVEFQARYYGQEADKKSELTEANTVESILAAVKKGQFDVTDVKKKERKQNPTPPFTTSKLQQDAANKLGFTAKRTMMVAQKLYEGAELGDLGTHGLITYMRTDSVRTEPEALNQLRDFIVNKYGNDFVAAETIIYKKKGTSKVQDAHEAIRPANLDFSPEMVKDFLEADEYKLYSLIWNKFLASQMAPAVIDQTTVTIENNGHFFKTNGSIIKFPGFRTIYLEAAIEKAKSKNDEDADEETTLQSTNLILPVINVGEKLKPLNDVFSEEHWTSPPPRYNEASLVKELEEQGIGRPSTYAAIISNIQDRGYVEKMENRFYPTELGEMVCRMLIQSFPDVMSVSFTANMEDQLDKVEEGELKWKKVLKDFWATFEGTLKTAQEEMKNLKKQAIPTGMKCLKCESGEYNIKWGRNGQFFACSNYPDCNSTQDFKKHVNGKYEILPKEFYNKLCPECGKRLIVKSGRYGRFVTCEEYPQCKVTLPYELAVQCPECKKGNFVEKKSRFGKLFYGCSNYPECSNAVWTFPVKDPCPKCGYAIMCEKISKKLGNHLECPKCRHKVERAQEVETETVAGIEMHP